MSALRKVSVAQQECLVQWMESHPLQAKGSHHFSPQVKQTCNRLWEEVSTRLNAMGEGTAKTPKEWRTYWSDLKCKVKKRGAAIRQQVKGLTWDGLTWGDILTPLEERILSIMGVENIRGNENVRIKVDMGVDCLPAPAPKLPPPCGPDIPVKVSHSSAVVIDLPNSDWELEPEAELESEAAAEAQVDVEVEAEPDVEVEAEVESEVDSEAEVESEVESEVEVEAVAKPEPQSEPEYIFSPPTRRLKRKHVASAAVDADEGSRPHLGHLRRALNLENWLSEEQRRREHEERLLALAEGQFAFAKQAAAAATRLAEERIALARREAASFTRLVEERIALARQEAAATTRLAEERIALAKQESASATRLAEERIAFIRQEAATATLLAEERITLAQQEAASTTRLAEEQRALDKRRFEEKQNLRRELAALSASVRKITRRVMDRCTK